VDRCFENITKRFDELDQTVRDLLQFACHPTTLILRPQTNHIQEFAWVSINEAFKSTSTATSAKRLSWVTVRTPSLTTEASIDAPSSFSFLLCLHR
jgi:hypothetical protein